MRVMMAMLGLFVLAAPAAPGAPLQADVLVIEKQPWSGAQPQSPSFAPGRSGLDFALVRASGSRGLTLALIGAARVPDATVRSIAGGSTALSGSWLLISAPGPCLRATPNPGMRFRSPRS